MSVGMASLTPVPTLVSSGSSETAGSSRPTIEIAIELVAAEPEREEADVASFLAEWNRMGTKGEADAGSVPDSPEGAWSWNLTTNELALSTSWQEMLGLWNGQLGASPDEWFSRIHPDDLPSVMGAVDDLMSGSETAFAIGYRIRHADGSYRSVQTRAVVERDSSGAAVRMSGAQRDMTGRR